MKTFKNLHSELCSFDNLYGAWCKARKGKRYKHATANFELDLDKNLLVLHEQLTNQSWQPGAYRSFSVHEPKRRKISAAPFADRVVHHALINVLEPRYEPSFIFDSYANRKGKGTHKALDRATQFLKNYKFVMHCDVKQFFPAIDHEILKSIFAKRIACEPTLDLCRRIVDSGAGILDDLYTLHWFTGDDLYGVNRPRGLPVGNLTSQFWANVYLNELDQFVKHQLRFKAYLRYVDDFLLFADSKLELHNAKDAIVSFLASLRLTMHETRAQPQPVSQGLTFLGFRLYPDYRRLKRRNVVNAYRRLKHKQRAVQSGVLSQEDLTASWQSWLGHAQHGNTVGLQSMIKQQLGMA